jgi:hypothetical protein
MVVLRWFRSRKTNKIDVIEDESCRRSRARIWSSVEYGASCGVSDGIDLIHGISLPHTADGELVRVVLQL